MLNYIVKNLKKICLHKIEVNKNKNAEYRIKQYKKRRFNI